MFIKDVKIKNFRIFPPDGFFEVKNLNIPDKSSRGSGLNVIIGNNATGKTSILDAIALSLLEYKGDGFEPSDMNNLEKDTELEVIAKDNFKFKGTMPNTNHNGKGFRFKANIRKKNSNYLSSLIVHDLFFIQADGEKKLDDASPDLRVSVNNPWAGKRFTENEVIYIEKNRVYATKKGTFNDTKFDRLMEDFSRRFIKNGDRKKLDECLEIVSKELENESLNKAISEFKSLSEMDVSLVLLDNVEPFKNAFFASRSSQNTTIPLNKLGSGYEMVFSLLYLFYLSKQNKKNLIILIDEPELHLHPKLQEEFIEIIFEFSKDAQIILTSHSPLLLKHILYNQDINVKVLKREENDIQNFDFKSRTLNNISSNEINYLAYDLITEEFHNELYGALQRKSGVFHITDFDEYLTKTHHVKLDKKWIKSGNKTDCSLHTYIRNSIHHPENKNNPSYAKKELESSITAMIKILKRLKEVGQNNE